jgi:hypothetical protein
VDYRRRTIGGIVSVTFLLPQKKQKLRREISMRNAVLAVSFLLALAYGTAASARPELLVQQFRFDKVSNPNQIRPVLSATDSKEFQSALTVAGKMFGATPALPSIVGIANVMTMQTQDVGGEHYGYWQSPAGYTVCRADLENAKFNNMSTFDVSLRLPHPNRISIDGAFYHFMSGKAAPGDSWIDGTVTLTYVQLGLRNKYNCTPHGTCVWLLKDGQFNHDVGPCVNPIGDVPIRRTR